MNKISHSDVLDLTAYEKARPEFQQRIRKIKDLRRLQVSELVTVFFENRETMRYQLQEIVRAERIVEDELLQEQLDTWNELIPGRDEFSVTLMIHETNPAEVKATLRRLKGFDEELWLELNGEQIRPKTLTHDVPSDMTTAVHYLRFPLTGAQRERILAEDCLSFVIEHPSQACREPISGAYLAALREDLLASLEDSIAD